MPTIISTKRFSLISYSGNQIEIGNRDLKKLIAAFLERSGLNLSNFSAEVVGIGLKCSLNCVTLYAVRLILSEGDGGTAPPIDSSVWIRLICGELIPKFGGFPFRLDIITELSPIYTSFKRKMLT